MSAFAILDRQHYGKGGHHEDWGAQADLDRDGMVEAWEREAQLTPVYIAHALRQLAQHGIGARQFERGNYGERHRQAVDLAQVWRGTTAYCACHLNAGGGDYALVGYDRRSPAGQALAACIAAQWRKLPVVSRCVVRPYDSTMRGWSCIDGIYAGPEWLSGVLLEPLFLDCSAHQDFILQGGLEAVGTLLADAIAEWASS